MVTVAIILLRTWYKFRFGSVTKILTKSIYIHRLPITKTDGFDDYLNIVLL